MGKILQFRPQKNSNLSDLDLAFQTIKAQNGIDYKKMFLGTEKEKKRAKYNIQQKNARLVLKRGYE